ncbi:MAG TPA: DUF6015 family protein [Thermoplasmata archaeon]|nr:DUF6015 family protein [Thermoplasmata archaeon]
MTPVLHSELRAALKATVGRRGMSDEEIGVLTDYVLSFFGHESEIIDNRLDVDDRDVFYMLEEEGLLGTRQEEVHIRRGKLWRIHYWVLRTDRVKMLARAASGEAGDEAPGIYQRVPEDVWSRTAPSG